MAPLWKTAVRFLLAALPSFRTCSRHSVERPDCHHPAIRPALDMSFGQGGLEEPLREGEAVRNIYVPFAVCER